MAQWLYELHKKPHNLTRLTFILSTILTLMPSSSKKYYSNQHLYNGDKTWWCHTNKASYMNGIAEIPSPILYGSHVWKLFGSPSGADHGQIDGNTIQRGQIRHPRCSGFTLAGFYLSACSVLLKNYCLGSEVSQVHPSLPSNRKDT